MKKLFCKIFGHDWRYNFPNMPNKRICARCKKKQQDRILSPYVNGWTDEFVFTSPYEDYQLIEKWFKIS